MSNSLKPVLTIQIPVTIPQATDRMKSSTGEQLYGCQFALQVGERILDLLRPATDRIIIAGSIRRKRRLVHDIEILFIPKVQDSKADMFEATPVDLADAMLEKLLSNGVITQRYNSNGSPTWGKQNKLARLVNGDIPVDFFATTKLNWWNALVVRTGGKETNLLISKTALERGWSFEAYGSGYHKTKDKDERHDCDSERDVFQFIGLPFDPPEKRR